MRENRRADDGLNEVPHVADHVDKPGGGACVGAADVDYARPVGTLPKIVGSGGDASENHRFARRMDEAQREDRACRGRAPSDRKHRTTPSPPTRAADNGIGQPAAEQARDPREKLRRAAHDFRFVERHVKLLIKVFGKPADKERVTEAAEKIKQREAPEARGSEQSAPNAGRWACIIENLLRSYRDFQGLSDRGLALADEIELGTIDRRFFGRVIAKPDIK